MTVNVGDKVEFRPLLDVRCLGIDEKEIVEVGTVVSVNGKHRWFSVEYGNPTRRASFLFSDIGEKVYFVNKLTPVKEHDDGITDKRRNDLMILKKKYTPGAFAKKTPVKCVELNKTFDSIKEAAAFICTDRDALEKCLQGKTQTCGGYHWERVKEKEN